MTLRWATLVVLCLCAVSCRSTYTRVPSHSDWRERPTQTLYLVGDFGYAGDTLERVSTSIAQELATGAGLNAPCIVELGDNLYPSGLPRGASSGSAEVVELGEIAERWARCRWRDAPVSLYLLPGNHDYDGEALDSRRRDGDIAQWYFLDQLGVPHTENWIPIPGTKTRDDPNAASLAARIYESPEEQTVFMAPRRLSAVSDKLAVVAIDSQMLLDLYRTNRADLAHEYLDRLRVVLKSIPNQSRRALATHHPIETFGKHRPMSWGRFCFGPGWPQFARWEDKITWIPPVGTLASVFWWLAHDVQDIHNRWQRRYARELYQLLEDERVSLVFSGHDHCLQLIDLREAFGDPAGVDEPPILQIVSGAAAKRDPVDKGPGLLAYHTGGGYVRVQIHVERLEIELMNADGELLFRWVL